MISKVFSALTIVLAGVAVYFGLQAKDAVTALQADLKDTKGKLVAETALRVKTQAELAATKTELEATKADLEATRGKLRETEATLATTKSDLDKVKTDLAMKDQQLASIQAELDKLGGGKKIEELGLQIAEMTAKVKDQEAKIGTLEKEKIELNNTVASLETNVKAKEEKIAQDTVKIVRWEKSIMLKGTSGKVMAVNPGWGFAVLSIGDKQGAAANKIMIVGRGGQSIGKVKITSVENNQSIADIIPGSFVKGMYVEPGDEVIFTGDDKVQTDVVVGDVTKPVLPE